MPAAPSSKSPAQLRRGALLQQAVLARRAAVAGRGLTQLGTALLPSIHRLMRHYNLILIDCHRAAGNDLFNLCNAQGWGRGQWWRLHARMQEHQHAPLAAVAKAIASLLQATHACMQSRRALLPARSASMSPAW